MTRKKRVRLLGDVIGLLVAGTIFVVPFIFMLVSSLKERREANLLQLSLPKVFQWENYLEVIKANNYLLIRSFKNSAVLTAGSVILLVLLKGSDRWAAGRCRSRW